MATQYTAGLTTGQVLTAATMNSIGAAWESYTPVITQGVTLTKTTQFGKYTQINKLVVYTAKFIFTSTGSASNEIQVALPINNQNPNVSGAFGSALFYDTSAGRYYNLVAVPTFAGQLRFIYDNTAAYFGVSPAVTTGNNDELGFTVVYEAV